jgi:hypothetical protein
LLRLRIYRISFKALTKLKKIFLPQRKNGIVNRILPPQRIPEKALFDAADLVVLGKG